MPRSFFRVPAVLLLAAGIVLTTACSAQPSGEPRTVSVRPPTPDASASASVSASASASPTTSAAAYGKKLDSAIRPLDASLRGIDGAKTLPALEDRLGEASLAATSALNSLALVDPPAGLAKEHQRLVSALGVLDKDLDEVRSVVDERLLCASSSALDYLNKLFARKQLPEAVKALQGKGFRFKLSLPVSSHPYVGSPRNGDYVASMRSGKTGGVLEVRNDFGSDVAVTLFQGKRSVVSMYVREGMRATVGGIPDGTYELFVASGQEWDNYAKTFAKNCQDLRYPVRLVYDKRRSTGYPEIEIELVAPAERRSVGT